MLWLYACQYGYLQMHEQVYDFGQLKMPIDAERVEYLVRVQIDFKCINRTYIYRHSNGITKSKLEQL